MPRAEIKHAQARSICGRRHALATRPTARAARVRTASGVQGRQHDRLRLGGLELAKVCRKVKPVHCGASSASRVPPVFRSATQNVTQIAVALLFTNSINLVMYLKYIRQFGGVKTMERGFLPHVAAFFHRCGPVGWFTGRPQIRFQRRDASTTLVQPIPENTTNKLESPSRPGHQVSRCHQTMPTPRSATSVR